MNENYLSKVCKECNIEKELSEFYTHPQGVLWTLPRCKSCITKGRKSERERAMARVSDKKRSSDIKRKEYCAKHLIDFRLRNPYKVKAQRLVWNYYKRNKSEKPTKCYVTWVEGWIIHLHHFDYEQPNKVIPCTPKIHSDFHHWRIEVKEEYILTLPF